MITRRWQNFIFVSEDQILMYKMVGTPSKFRNRFERKSDLDLFDESIAHIEFLHNDEGTNINTCEQK
jgi:hypothetical protein